MHPTLVSKPFHREGLLFEEKVDGYRMLAYKVDRSVKLVSRQGVDHTSRYPDIVTALRALEVPTLILDGEIAILDKKFAGRAWYRDQPPRFSRVSAAGSMKPRVDARSAKDRHYGSVHREHPALSGRQPW